MLGIADGRWRPEGKEMPDGARKRSGPPEGGPAVRGLSGESYQLQGASPFSWRSDLKMVSGTSSPW